MTLHVNALTSHSWLRNAVKHSPQSSPHLHPMNHQNAAPINEYNLSTAYQKQHQRVFSACLSLSLSLCSVCQSGLGDVRGSLSRRTDHKHTHMLSLSCVSRPFSQTKPLRHIGNGTVTPSDFMHTIQIYSSQHCLSVRSVVLNWFSFRSQIFFGSTPNLFIV